MAFKISLNIGTRTYDALSCSFSFSRQTQGSVTTISGGDLVFTIDLKRDTSLVETILDPKAHSLSGSVKFIDSTPGANTVIKEIKYSGGFIQAYQEMASVEGSNNLTINFILSAMEVKIGSATFKNPYM